MQLNFCTASQSTDETPALLATEKAVWSWADASESGHAVFVSRQSDGVWGEPEIISSDESINFVPTMTKLSDEEIIVVWSSFIEGRSQLRYREFKKGLWWEEREYYSDLSSNTAPSVAVDGKGQLWLVWSGFNGVSDEIYYSKWGGSSFEKAEAITSNNIPDIQPVLGVDEETKMVWVQWQRFTETGYVIYETIWNGRKWSEPAEVAIEKEESTSQINSRESTLSDDEHIWRTGQIDRDKQFDELEIPTFISDVDSAAIHIPDYAVQSLPVRNMLSSE